MDFYPVKTKRIYETIIEQIKNLIVSEKLHPGDRLPSERKLSEEFQVSRASVREALIALHMAGLISIRRGEGAFVSRTDPQNTIEALSFAFLLERKNIKNLIEIRRGLEIEAAVLAAERASEDDLLKMKQALEQMKADLHTGSPGDTADSLFHYGIALATHNPLLISVMNTIYDTLNRTLKITRKMWMLSTTGTPRRLYEEHMAIFRAIESHNGLEAGRKMTEHLNKITEFERVSRLPEDPTSKTL